MKAEDFDILLFLYQHDILRDLTRVHKYYDRVEDFFDKEIERLENEFENKAEKYNSLDAN